jgi:hypothetical protein
LDSYATITAAADIAFAALEAVDKELDKLPVAQQFFICVYTSHAIMVNGGLEYFYESDFEDQRPYAYFVKAFRAVGLDRAARCIEASERMLGVDEAHLHEAKRQAALEVIKADEAHPFHALSFEVTMRGELVERKLAEYALKHRALFGL